MVRKSLILIVLLFFVGNAWAVTPAETALLPLGLKVLAALVAVLGLMLVLSALVKKSGRWFPAAKNTAIRLIEVRYLSPKKVLYLVEVNGAQLLLAASADRLEKIAQWPADETFGQLLQDQVASREAE